VEPCFQLLGDEADGHRHGDHDDLVHQAGADHRHLSRRPDGGEPRRQGPQRAPHLEPHRSLGDRQEQQSPQRIAGGGPHEGDEPDDGREVRGQLGHVERGLPAAPERVRQEQRGQVH
jgi:hypothetical protein